MPAIIKYNPWSMLRDIQDEVNQLFNHNLMEKGISEWSPHVDITETKDKYSIIADLPGVDPKDLKVSVENNFLTIEGERKSEAKQEKEGYSRIERYSGKFKRQFSLPENIEVNKIQAKNRKNGVVEILLPKRISGGNNQLDIKIED